MYLTYLHLNKNYSSLNLKTTQKKNFKFKAIKKLNSFLKINLLNLKKTKKRNLKLGLKLTKLIKNKKIKKKLIFKMYRKKIYFNKNKKSKKNHISKQVQKNKYFEIIFKKPTNEEYKKRKNYINLYFLRNSKKYKK